MRIASNMEMACAECLDGEKDPREAIAAVSRQIQAEPINVAFVGIGENGRLAFNDPPADFDTEEAYPVVELDLPGRRQQVGEGWFASIEDVPTHAISMSIRQIIEAREIICIVPDRRKAEAVRMTLEGEISPMAPASILRTRPHTTKQGQLTAEPPRTQRTQSDSLFPPNPAPLDECPASIRPH
jgi:glucosamine-6-phosphate deaminase